MTHAIETDYKHGLVDMSKMKQGDYMLLVDDEAPECNGFIVLKGMSSWIFIDDGLEWTMASDKETIESKSGYLISVGTKITICVGEG